MKAGKSQADAILAVLVELFDLKPKVILLLGDPTRFL